MDMPSQSFCSRMAGGFVILRFLPSYMLKSREIQKTKTERAPNWMLNLAEKVSMVMPPNLGTFKQAETFPG